MQHRGADAVDLEAVTGSRRMPGHAVGRAADRGSGCIAGRPRPRQARSPGPVRSRAITAGSAAEVVGVGMGDDRERERPGTLPLKKRRHDAAARIHALARGSGVHQDPVSAGGPDQGGVALSDVQKM